MHRLQLFEQLPKRTPDGDAAIQAVWQMAKDETARMNDVLQMRFEAVLDSLPEEVREAFLSGDEERMAAAFAQLSPEQQQTLRAALEAGAEPDEAAPEPEA